MVKTKASIVSQGLPFFAFIIASWYGLSSLVQNKRDLGSATRGLDSVEEMDPVERMRRRYRISESESKGSVPIPSLEDELNSVQKSINIYDFDYKPVPRTEEEEE